MMNICKKKKELIESLQLYNLPISSDLVICILKTTVRL